MTEWIDHDEAIKLICDARKIGVGAALQFLIKACAEDVRSRERPCWASYALGGPTIPAPVWKGSHLDIGSGELFPAGSTEVYGEGGNGIIEIAEDDLRERLRMPAPRKRGRKPKLDWDDIKRQTFTLFEHQGAPSAIDPEWASQADVERAIQDILARDGIEVAESTVRKYAGQFLEAWQVQKADKGR